MDEQDKKVGYDEAASITGLCKATLYTKVSRKEIPHYRLSPRLVVFSLGELTQWLADRHVEVRP